MNSTHMMRAFVVVLVVGVTGNVFAGPVVSKIKRDTTKELGFLIVERARAMDLLREHNYPVTGLSKKLEAARHKSQWSDEYMISMARSKARQPWIGFGGAAVCFAACIMLSVKKSSDEESSEKRQRKSLIKARLCTAGGLLAAYGLQGVGIQF